MKPLRAPARLLTVLFGVSGCMPASPSVPLWGAYFPFWLVCAGIGVAVAVLGRVLFIRLGIDDGLPVRLLVYVCLGLLAAFGTALMLYGR